jgi:hypothetical protein
MTEEELLAAALSDPDAQPLSPEELAKMRRVSDDQLWFHHLEMRARLARAEEDLARGRSSRTETPEEAQAFLDSLKSRRVPAT